MFRRLFGLMSRRRRRRAKEEERERQRAPALSPIDNAKELKNDSFKPMKKDEEKADEELYTVGTPEGSATPFGARSSRSSSRRRKKSDEVVAAPMMTQDADANVNKVSDEKREGEIDPKKVKLRRRNSLRDRKRLAIANKDETRAAIVHTDPSSLSQKKPPSKEKKKTVDVKTAVDEDENMETRPKIAIPEMYRKKLKKSSPSPPSPQPPPPSPPVEAKESEEEIDYWLYPDGKPKKNFEITAVPSQGDLLLKEPNAQCLAKSTLPGTPELPKIYGAADRSLPQKPKDQGPFPKTSEFPGDVATCRKPPKEVIKTIKKPPLTPGQAGATTATDDLQRPVFNQQQKNFLTPPAKPPTLPVQQPNQFPRAPAAPIGTTPSLLSEQSYFSITPAAKKLTLPVPSPQQPNHFPGAPVMPSNYFNTEPLKNPALRVPRPLGVLQSMKKPPETKDPKQFATPPHYPVQASCEYFRPP